MKKVLSIILSVIMIMGVTSCDNWLDVNSNPDKPNNMSTPVEIRLPWIQYFYMYAYANASVRTSATAQIITENSATAITVNARWDQSTSPSTTPYQNWYVGGASNIPDLVALAEAEGATHYVAACKILKSMGAIMMVDIYGEMPYIEACSPNYPSPKYNNGEETFDWCMQDLEDAILLLKSPQKEGATPLSAGDAWNGGDVNKWIKLAYGLKARWLGNLSKTDRYNTQDILDAIALAPQSNSENIVMNHANVTQADKSFISSDAYGPSVIWDVAAWGTGKRLNRWYVDLLTNFKGTGVEDPRANKLIPHSMYKVEINPADGTIMNYEWLRDAGVNLYGNDEGWIRNRYVVGNINAYLTYATKDVAKGYTKKDILKNYVSVDAFVAAIKKYYSDNNATVEVGNFKYVLKDDKIDSYVITTDPVNDGEGVKDKDYVAEGVVVTYHKGAMFVNDVNPGFVEDIKYVQYRADGYFETAGLSLTDMNCYYSAVSANTRALGFVQGTGAFYTRPNSDSDIMTYSEMCFLKAEVLFRKGEKANALAAYHEGIKAHFDRMNTKLSTWQGAGSNKTYYGVDVSFAYNPIPQSEIDAYMASDAVAQTAAELEMSDIMMQKMIAMGYSIQNWNDVRRFNYFLDNLGFGVVYEGMQVPAFREFKNAEYSTDPESDMFFPRRWMHCSHETNYNSTNCNAAVEQYAQYGIESATDKQIYSIPVWWDWTKKN